jgi:hypothetical protein
LAFRLKSNHNARVEHILYDNYARVREWSLFYTRIKLKHRRVAPGGEGQAAWDLAPGVRKTEVLSQNARVLYLFEGA